jgi:uncharacterized protein
MSYPEPAVTDVNRPLIEAWRRGELMLQHCGDCGLIVFFPRALCPRCWSERLEWKASAGRGTIVSFSRVYSHVTEPFASESPTVLAEIALEDGGALLARVVTSRPEAVESGQRVELVTMPDAQRYPLPTFRAAS